MTPFVAIIIGGDAAGMSAASQIKRKNKNTHVIALEKTMDVSYSACGMPYNIGLNRHTQELLEVSAEDFIQKRGIDLRLLNEAVGLNPREKMVIVEDKNKDKTYEIKYDKLFIGTGAKAGLINIDGINNEGIFTLKALNDARLIKDYLQKKKPKKAVLIGGGFINLELAEGFRNLNLDVTILEKLPFIMENYEDEIREIAEKELEKHNIKLYTDINITSVDSNLRIETDKGVFEADIINVAVGLIPNTQFLKSSGIAIDNNGAIIIDRYAKTNDDDVYAGGDCALIYHRLLKRNVFSPLGTNANKIGRLAGTNMLGMKQEFAGIMGSSIFKLFDVGIAKTGLSFKEATNEGYSAFKTVIHAKTRARSYPDAKNITVALITEKKTGKLLGGQIIAGDDASLRIDIISAALYANFTVRDLQGLDLAYAPPYSPVWDPVLVCANQAIKGV